MPTVPHGPLEGAEYYHVKLSRGNDDIVPVPDKGDLNMVRISIGGHDEIGYYLKFRGDPERVVKVMEIMTEAVRTQLPRGRYDDQRTR